MPFTTDMHDTSAPNAATPVLLAEDLSFTWPGSATACLGINRLALNAGEHVLLLGPSGGGKSTLLGLLGGVLRLLLGRVFAHLCPSLLRGYIPVRLSRR